MDITDEVITEMKKKHPSARAEDRAKCRGLTRRPRVKIKDWDKAEVETAIWAFPKDSAPGYTGLRPAHLKDALMPINKNEILELLAQVSNLMSAGLVCPEAKKWLVGANLHALPKSSGGLRPVAVGDDAWSAE